MRKIVYKSIFSIVIVLFTFLMLPNKQVKAQEQGYPTYLLKAPLYQAYYEKANTSTHEYLAQYVLDGIVVDTINDYFFIIKHYTAVNKGYDNEINSYELEDIEPYSDFTIINVRFTFTTYFLNSNYGEYDILYVYPLFLENSAFYVEFDVYSLGYGNGFNAGRDFGRSIGYQEGYVEGHYEGYWEGYENGHNIGYNKGFEEGYEEGEWNGYIDGHTVGYNKGYILGIDEGYGLGYNDGYNDGYSDGISKPFYSNFDKWIVPAIIIVVIAGIFVGYRRERYGGD